jgi:hypothetical protein
LSFWHLQRPPRSTIRRRTPTRLGTTSTGDYQSDHRSLFPCMGTALDGEHYWKSRKISGMATRPGDFQGGSQIINSHVSRLEPFYRTNKGLCLILPLVRQGPGSEPLTPGTRYIAILTDFYQSKNRTLLDIHIYPDESEDNFYYRTRVRDSNLCFVTDSMLKQARTETFYLATRDIPNVRLSIRMENDLLRVTLILR